ASGTLIFDLDIVFFLHIFLSKAIAIKAITGLFFDITHKILLKYFSNYFFAKNIFCQYGLYM
ncbi:MAG: hypothetical protein K5768_00365, partial [Firmicutes bacterium]|nr:hypothetical protein [Bacillota bacterium]